RVWVCWTDANGLAVPAAALATGSSAVSTTARRRANCLGNRLSGVTLRLLRCARPFGRAGSRVGLCDIEANVHLPPAFVALQPGTNRGSPRVDGQSEGISPSTSSSNPRQIFAKSAEENLYYRESERFGRFRASTFGARVTTAQAAGGARTRLPLVG